MNHNTLLKVDSIWRASAEGRVSRHSARALALDAERERAGMHTAIDSLPKEASASDVAHSLWAQLPVSQRNIEGLTLVRDKMAAELRTYTSGQRTADAMDELEQGQAALKDMEWQSPEARAQLKRNGQLRALLTDIPFIEEDLGTQLVTLDAAITAKPKLDSKIIDGMRDLADSREKALLEAGAPGSDAERFANRRGLLSSWLGLEPTGEEIYLGHRMGNVTGAPSDLVPQAVGVGRPTTPQGLSRANNLVLANTGRMRMSTHVAYEDWNRAQTFKFALRQRDDLGKIGHAYDGGRLEEGSLLVNPHARPTPKAWKEDPFNLVEGDESVIEDKVKQMLSQYAAEADDPDAVKALKEAAHEMGIPMTDLRVVPKRTAERYVKQFAPYRYTGTSRSSFSSSRCRLWGVRWPEMVARSWSSLGNEVSVMTARSRFTVFTTSQNLSVGPVSLENAMAPFLSSRMNPVVGTMCDTRTARMVSPLITKGTSGSTSTSLSTGVRSLGRLVKSGHVWLLKRWFRMEAMTSAMA